MPELLGYHFQKAMHVDQKALLQAKKKPATQEKFTASGNLPLLTKRYKISKIILINTEIFLLFMKN